jgi:hypothetical protein
MAESRTPAKKAAAKAQPDEADKDVTAKDPDVAAPVEATPAEADAMREMAARALEDDHALASPIQQGMVPVLDATVTADEDSAVKPEANDESDDPCAECYPDGWATVGHEPGARLSCEHGSWVND